MMPEKYHSAPINVLDSPCRELLCFNEKGDTVNNSASLTRQIHCSPLLRIIRARRALFLVTAHRRRLRQGPVQE